MMHPVYSFRLLIMVSYLLCVGDLMGQKKRTVELFAGPNLTNVQHIENGVKLYYITPERPFYTIQYHFGVTLNEGIFSKEEWSLSYGLSFDKRASANTGFNKYIDEGYGFLGIPILLNYKPLKNRDIRLEIGTNFQYLVYNSKYVYTKAFKNFELDYVVGIQSRLWNKTHIGFRFMEPLLLMKERSKIVPIDPNLPKVTRQFKTHSMELYFMYKFKI